MKKTYFVISILVFSFLTLLADDVVKILNIQRGNNTISIPISNIDSISHSRYDMDSIFCSNYMTTVVWRDSTAYRFPLAEVEDMVLGELKLTAKELADNIIADVSNYLDTNRETTFMDVQEHLRKYGELVTSKIQDSILIINLPEGYRLDVDLYGLSLMSETNWEEYNEAEIESFSQDLYSNLGLLSNR